jgi:cell wall assembly regulator SMI1
VSRSTKPSCTELLQRLERWLAKHRRRYRAGLRPGASAADLDTLQAELGRPLPADLRTLLAWHDGQNDDFIGHFESDWDLLSVDGIRAAKKELDAEKPTGWQTSFIPVLADDMGDYFCLDADQPAAPVRIFWQGRKEPEAAAPSLTAWLADFVAAVERGAYHQDPERGSFLRSEG